MFEIKLHYQSFVLFILVDIDKIVKIDITLTLCKKAV